MNAQLAAGLIPHPEANARSQLIETNQNQLRWAQEQLRERFGNNPAAQQVLSQLRDVPANGIYDPQTQQAIASFRQAFGLSPDGGMDAEYRNLLNALIVGPLDHSQPNRFPTSQTALAFANQWEQAALATPQSPAVAIGTSLTAPSPSTSASSAQAVDTERVSLQLTPEQQAVLQQVVDGELKVGWLENSRGPHIQVLRDLMMERATALGITGFTNYRSDIFGSRDNELLNALRVQSGVSNTTRRLTPEDVKALFGYPQ
jgi:peptidoglycan hydrolase-like protein with peptidoglycan-binding domain